jgi:hypothetical protein
VCFDQECSQASVSEDALDSVEISRLDWILPSRQLGNDAFEALVVDQGGRKKENTGTRRSNEARI